MKVATYEGIRAIRLQEWPYPKIGPNEAIVKVKYCGICGTDLHTYTQGRIRPFVPGQTGTSPLIMGHEVVGTVAELGKEVKGWEIGDRVVIGPPGSCGECYFCQRGEPQLCVHAMRRTIGSFGVDGGMAEYVKVAYPKNMLVKIPDKVTFEDAVLTDTVAASFHGINISRFKIGNNVVVSGAGPIGLAAIQFLKIGGARHITVLQPSPIKRQMALEYGADLALNPLEESNNLPGKIGTLYDDVGADVVFECAGTPESFKLVLTLARDGGQVILVGSNRHAEPMSEAQFKRGEVDIKGSHVYNKNEISLCLDFIAQGRFKTKGMVSDIISLDDIVDKGFERLATERGKLVKIIIAP